MRVMHNKLRALRNVALVIGGTFVVLWVIEWVKS